MEAGMPPENFKALAIVIPTRNRSDMVGLALKSALALAPIVPIRVFVSDNSTDPEESDRIKILLAAIADDRVCLLKPPEPMSMTLHWDWAMSEVLRTTDASHVAYLTDRMFLRPALFQEAMRACKKFPGEIISYADDRLNDERLPIVYRPAIRSGKVYRIQSQSLLDLSSRMVFYTCLPRMLNCIAPREHLERLAVRYRTYFDSVSPDFSFCYRSLESTESIIYLDKSVMLSHGHARSNGHSFIRGASTDATKDFLRHLGPNILNADSPLPNVLTVGNGIASEYLRVRRESGSVAMRPLSLNAYMAYLAGEIDQFTDRDHATAVSRQLKEAGWEESGWSGLNPIKTATKEWFHSLIAQHYDDADVAMVHASMDLGRTFPWVHRFARKYRCEEVDIN
jgi:hypothetical protein